MSEQKDSFVFYRSFYDAFKRLKDKDRLKAYDAICKLALDEVDEEPEGNAAVAYILVRPQIEANNRRYNNGKKGGAPTKEKITKVQPKDNQDVTKVQPKDNLMENVNENVNVNVNENENGKKASYGKFKNVLLSLSEYEDVISWTDGKEMLDKFSSKLKSKGYKYADHYAAICEWHSSDSKATEKSSFDMDKFKKRAEKLPKYEKER